MVLLSDVLKITLSVPSKIDFLGTIYIENILDSKACLLEEKLQGLKPWKAFDETLAFRQWQYCLGKASFNGINIFLFHCGHFPWMPVWEDEQCRQHPLYVWILKIRSWMNVTDKSKRTCCAAAWAVLNVEALCSAQTDYKIRENTKGMA